MVCRGAQAEILLAKGLEATCTNVSGSLTDMFVPLRPHPHYSSFAVVQHCFRVAFHIPPARKVVLNANKSIVNPSVTSRSNFGDVRNVCAVCACCCCCLKLHEGSHTLARKSAQLCVGSSIPVTLAVYQYESWKLCIIVYARMLVPG